MVKEKETRESLVGGIETEATGCLLVELDTSG